MAAASAALSLVVVEPHLTVPPEEAALLKEIGFSAHDIQKIARGEIVARPLETDSSSVALAVAGTIHIPPAFYVERFRSIEKFKRAAEVHQIGRFAREPEAADAATLTFDDDDIDDLRDCRLEHCGVKLDADGISAIANRDAKLDTASAALRTHLAGYVRRYLQSGNSALIEYREASRPRRLADDLRAITARLEYARRRWPSLLEAVNAFTGTLPEGLEGFVYWSKEKVGPRPVVSVTHAIIAQPHDAATAIATKQLYASHYTNASLGLTLLLDIGTPEAARTRLVYVNHSRVDLFGGILGGLKRQVVRSRAREGAERTVRGLSQRLESQYRAQ